ncbi:MAG: hypothetical protein ABJG88_13240 [Litorimonas sp.]
MKTYNICNGLFYLAYGLFGAFLPLGMAGVMGWDPNLLGLHQIRAISMAMSAMGLAAFISALRSQNPIALTKVFILLTVAFMAGRLLGLAFDGAGPTQTYAEIGFEVFWATIGFIILKGSSLAAKPQNTTE